MAQQTGRGLLIKRGDGGSPTEVFTTICGFLARSFTINNNAVDVTVPDCVVPTGRVIETMVYGVQSLQFNGSGLFDNDAASVATANASLNQTLGNYQIVVPGWGTFQGQFLIENYALSGDKEGNLEFEATWRLSGSVTFTAGS